MAEPSTALNRGPTSGVHQTVTAPKPPLLASEALREELAPLQPGAGACRLVLVGIALSMVALGIAMRLGVGVPAIRLDASTLSFSMAGAIAAVAVLPFPYAVRATLAILLGGGMMALGLRGAGPLAGMAVDGATARSIARLVVLTALPAALLFRSRYRAYRRARVVLAAALVLALPFVGLELALGLNDSAPVIARVGAISSIGIVALSLFGFMGQGTTGGGSVWAVLVLAALPLEVGLRHFTLADQDSGQLTYPATALGIVCMAALTSFGLYQLLATVFGPEARRLSVTPVRTDDIESSGVRGSKPGA